MGWFGGTIIFGNTHIYFSNLLNFVKPHQVWMQSICSNWKSWKSPSKIRQQETRKHRHWTCFDGNEASSIHALPLSQNVPSWHVLGSKVATSGMVILPSIGNHYINRTLNTIGLMTISNTGNKWELIDPIAHMSLILKDYQCWHL